eukprot:scaffold30285_cov63-Phaeocystis_antarctica.AAC.2
MARSGAHLALQKRLEVGLAAHTRRTGHPGAPGVHARYLRRGRAPPPEVSAAHHDQIGVLCAGDEVGPSSDRTIEPHLHRVLVPLPAAWRADRVQAAPEQRRHVKDVDPALLGAGNLGHGACR